MLKDNTKKFLEWAETTMPNLVGKSEPDIEEYDDGATLEYQLPIPIGVEEVMDIFEDDMDLTILFCAMRNDGNCGLQISAVTKPTGIYMFRFNAVAGADDMVTTVTAVIYDSVELMADEVLTDIRNLEEQDFLFNYKIEDGMLTALFCE